MTETSVFQQLAPRIEGNASLRVPQAEVYAALSEFTNSDDTEREVGIILPVGCGKSGCITLAPFAIRSRRTLVVAPGVSIASQLNADFDPANPQMFYLKTGVLAESTFPEPVEIRGTTTNIGDLEVADVVITNIQQLQGRDNRWMEQLPDDFFDLIQFDEGHHNVAATWENIKRKFPDAKIVNYSATPLRADGQQMAGRILYTYPIFRAIEAGYVKRLKGVCLNPTTLKYVRTEDGQELEVSLDEVRQLGEDEAVFRRGIVTSQETLSTIVNASIRELQRIRRESGDDRHKIIASALHYGHCIQIVEAFRARGLRADYVHSRQDSALNDQILGRLERHEIDVIVQVRKLGEGFDHPYLSVAAVCSVFNSLSPFVQFVGRIMRVISQNSPNDVMNQGSVVFHAGANIAARWEDFQEFSQADQEFFSQLLPTEDLNFDSGDELEITPAEQRRNSTQVEVQAQTRVMVEEIPLLSDQDAMDAIRLLTDRGYSADDINQAIELQPVPITRVRARQAARESLDERIRNAAGRLLAANGVNAQSQSLDRQRLGRTNFVVVKSAIDRAINAACGRVGGERSEFSQSNLDLVTAQFEDIVRQVEEDIFNG